MAHQDLRHRKKTGITDVTDEDILPSSSDGTARTHDGQHPATRCQPSVSESNPSADIDAVASSASEHTGVESEEDEGEAKSIFHDFLLRINVLIGLTVMTLIAMKYAEHLKHLHENEMWFSNIKGVEREISFRTESGLYYSYFKQMVEASSVKAGLYELAHDNRTEHPSTINVLARMNIYQEVVLGALYKAVPLIQASFEPIYLYIDVVFGLQAVMLCALYLMTWYLSGSWIASVLMSGFYIFNREDITRVSMTIPLRENWSLPFFYLQMLTLSVYFSPDASRRRQMLCTVCLYISTFLFSITWQFNQFVLFLQALALFACQLLDLLPHHKILTVYAVQVASLLSVCVLQFGNPMILSGLLMSFVPAAVAIMFCQNHLLSVCSTGFWRSVGKVIVYIVMALYILKLSNTVLKALMNQEADDHIFRFILAKLGWHDPRDFDVSLYLCNGAFHVMSPMTFVRLSYKIVFPVYLTVHSALLAAVVIDVCQRWMDAPYMTKDQIAAETGNFSIHPTMCYHAIQCVLYGLMAFSTMRMKYFWTPYMCVLASVGLADTQVWAWFLGALRCQSHRLGTALRYGVLLGVLAVLLYVAVPPALKELDELREFYDPDTVDLMEWIKVNTSTGAAFSGSMQLLAGVKLCTGRHITNHPHYEDKSLRLRTRELYQFYGRADPETVHAVLQRYDANYIILEDSICLSRRPDCRLTDTVDLAHGIMPEGGSTLPGVEATDTPRFCDQIRHGEADYTKYFQLVFENKTFRIYKVL